MSIIKAKNIVLLIIMVVLFSACGKQEEIKVMTFNLRYDGGTDKVNDWSNRKNWVISYLDSVRPDAIGTQELLHHQLQDILKKCSYYQSVGVGRDDGQQAGEYSAILFNRNKYKLIVNDTFWLSESPSEIGKKGWDAACPRVCTWACIESKQSGKRFFMFNTHFDHVGKQARIQSSYLITKRMEKIANGHPVVLLGDFNVNESSESFKYLTQEYGLSNSRKKAEPSAPVQGTFNGFGYVKECNSNVLIDHIFINDGFSVGNYQVDVKKREEAYISDHYPVIVDLNFN